MDYVIVAVTTLAGLVFHGWLFLQFRRWADRDLALSLAGSDNAKREWILQRLAAAQTLNVKRRELQGWLEGELQRYDAGP
ncbi:hypothetical protein [Stutzerimonas zhaodongensis]|uniref:hypothetical protein n=1 Tax=Stutzerimonas TaxID=2901164 RepID=UPI00388EB7C9